MSSAASDRSQPWPSLATPKWKESVETLHMWTQIVGKIRLAQSPWINHSWHVTSYVTPRGLTTSTIPYGQRSFEIEFDFLDHQLVVSTSDGQRKSMSLEAQTTAEFHTRLFSLLDALDISVKIHPKPNEVDPAIPFAEDTTHKTYDPDGVNAFFRALASIDRVFTAFRARFIGKVSPSHFFWGSFDHAVTRFSGRTAPEHPGGFPNMPDDVTREAYSHEVSSAGFWPGNTTADAFFYSYAYPTPRAFADAKVQPGDATWNAELGEFVLPYEAVRTASDPESTLMAFLQSTYEAAAEAANWDRSALEQSTIPKRF